MPDPDRPEQPAFRPERCAGGQQLYILTPERKPGCPGFRPTGAQPFAERPGGRSAAEERQPAKRKRKIAERADQAEAALRIKGRELDDARNALENGKEEIMQEARQKAEDIVANAHVRADQIKEDAQAEAQAMDVSARDQAKAQAQKLVDAAAAEANEIQNAHQLRLNNLRAEVREMEAPASALIDYLGPDEPQAA